MDACSRNLISFYSNVRNRKHCRPAVQGRGWCRDFRLSPCSESVEFNQVLLIDNEGDVKVGVPYVEGAVVKATVLEDDTKAKKVIVFKKIRRKGYQKSNGHRQKLTKIRIDSIA